MKKVYIAGKITGENKVKCIEKFYAAHQKIHTLGFEVFNPMQFNIPWETSSNKALEMCFPILDRAEILYVLPDWRQSKGALREINRFQARKQGPVFFEAEEGYKKLSEYSSLIK